MEVQQRLRHEIQDQVRATLGPEFQVQSFDIRKGSVTLLVAVSTVFAIYMGFSRYESFIKSANLLVSQLKTIAQRILGRTGNAGSDNLDVRGTWVSITVGSCCFTFSQAMPLYWPYSSGFCFVTYRRKSAAPNWSNTIPPWDFGRPH
jgi:hypothetical protein